MPKDYAKKNTKSDTRSGGWFYTFFLILILVSIFGIFIFKKISKTHELKQGLSHFVKHFSSRQGYSTKALHNSSDIKFDFYNELPGTSAVVNNKKPEIYILQVAEFNTENAAAVERVSLLFADVDATIAIREHQAGKVYTLEVGSFPTYVNAETEAQKLKLKGISCIIKRIA